MILMVISIPHFVVRVLFPSARSASVMTINRIQILRSSRKFCVDLEYSNTGIDSRQGAKYAKFRSERLIILQTILFIFSDLCGLGVFAGDIPSFGSGSAALRLCGEGKSGCLTAETLSTRSK
jgi:hypothetical protein